MAPGWPVLGARLDEPHHWPPGDALAIVGSDAALRDPAPDDTADVLLLDSADRGRRRRGRHGSSPGHRPGPGRPGAQRHARPRTARRHGAEPGRLHPPAHGPRGPPATRRRWAAPAAGPRPRRHRRRRRLTLRPRRQPRGAAAPLHRRARGLGGRRRTGGLRPRRRRPGDGRRPADRRPGARAGRVPCSCRRWWPSSTATPTSPTTWTGRCAASGCAGPRWPGTAPAPGAAAPPTRSTYDRSRRRGSRCCSPPAGPRCSSTRCARWAASAGPTSSCS